MIQLHDPRGLRQARHAPLAARPASLRGLTIGLLDNGKENADALLDRTAEHLIARGATVVRTRKPSHSRPAPDEVIAELAGYSAVVAAHGG
ncbi:MAG: hypothetical protein NVS3B16_21330 [Vulcanimicrobiaceae bacterium]